MSEPRCETSAQADHVLRFLKADMPQLTTKLGPKGPGDGCTFRPGACCAATSWGIATEMFTCVFCLCKSDMLFEFGVSARTLIAAC